jgi:spermidine/putrescine transport system permease protein
MTNLPNEPNHSDVVNTNNKPNKIFPFEIPLFIGPMTIIIAVFVFAPLLIILGISFLKSGIYGDLIFTFTLDNFKAALGSKYGPVFYRSIIMAFQTNVICILIGYPIAYNIARFGGKWKNMLLFLIIIPSWSSYLIRLYALKTLIGRKGILNTFFLDIGLISQPMEILYTQTAVMIGLIYAWLPFMVLPIYASIEGLDQSLLEASADLGSRPFRRFWRVTLPLTKGGLLAGSILCFIPTVGEWLVPQIFGGSKVMMAGSLVAQKFTGVGNMPQGASLAIMLATTLILILYLTIKWGGKDAMEKMI